MSSSESIDRSWDITVSITRKQIRHLYIRIDEMQGRVRVTAPNHLTDAQIWHSIRSREQWIRHRLERVQAKSVDPDSHRPVLLFGEAIPQVVHEHLGRPSIALIDGALVISLRDGSTDQDRLSVIENWQRAQLRARIPEMIATWEPVLGVGVAQWRIKRMRTRWGTCNITARRIWLNSELVQRPIECLEYVVVHEMVHLLERGHNRRFYGFLDRYLPDWRSARSKL